MNTLGVSGSIQISMIVITRLAPVSDQYKRDGVYTLVSVPPQHSAVVNSPTVWCYFTPVNKHIADVNILHQSTQAACRRSIRRYWPRIYLVSDQDFAVSHNLSNYSTGPTNVHHNTNTKTKMFVLKCWHMHILPHRPIGKWEINPDSPQCTFVEGQIAQTVLCHREHII